MSTIDLSDREHELLRLALHEYVDTLIKHKGWVCDRPQLPAIEAALGRIDAEVQELRNLGIKLYTAWRPLPNRDAVEGRDAG